MVSTPDDQHVVALKAAITAGIPVFCEKPVANSAADARELARRVAAAPVPATVGGAGGGELQADLFPSTRLTSLSGLSLVT